MKNDDIVATLRERQSQSNVAHILDNAADEIERLRADLGQRIRERDEWEANEQEQYRRAETAEADLAVVVRFMRENRAYISATNSAGDASVAFHGPKTVLSADAATLRHLLTEDNQT